MLIRPKAFLTCAVLCISPLIVLSLLSLHNSLRATRELVLSDLDVELARAMREFDGIEQDRKSELLALTRTRAMLSYLAAARRYSSAHGVARDQPRPSATHTGVAPAAKNNEPPIDARAELGAVLGKNQKYYAGIVVFDWSNQPMFVDEKLETKPEGAIIVQRQQWSFNQVRPDERVWGLTANEVACAIVRHPYLGQVLRCNVPVFTSNKGPLAVAALVVDIKTDQLISEATRHWDLPATGIAGNKVAPERMSVVLSSSEHIVYHTNSALRHQIVSTSMPYFAPVAAAMMAGRSGWQSYKSPAGDEWLAAYAPVKSSNVFFSVARNYSHATRVSWRNGWILVVLSVLMGLAAALLLSHYLERQRSRIERVSESVAAIAKGDLSHRPAVSSSDGIRSLSDNLNLMTTQLREQIARETEARQFQSFVKLSAMLTHDLKNAIGALSLIVGNMERHFDNEEFRADAMKSLNIATQNLRALVDRLTNPVRTLSGEYKRPRPVDLVPMLKRSLEIAAGSEAAQHEMEVLLPPSVMAVVDGERIEKVIENLVFNALEAMSQKAGKLTVSAGNAGAGKIFFSITDTGSGMSREFIDRQLYHPFATTKKRGVGLGLYTCREVVRANLGSIEVDSTEGAGTTFRVVLPSAAIEPTD